MCIYLLFVSICYVISYVHGHVLLCTQVHIAESSVGCLSLHSIICEGLDCGR